MLRLDDSDDAFTRRVLAASDSCVRAELIASVQSAVRKELRHQRAATRAQAPWWFAGLAAGAAGGAIALVLAGLRDAGPLGPFDLAVAALRSAEII